MDQTWQILKHLANERTWDSNQCKCLSLENQVTETCKNNSRIIGNSGATGTKVDNMWNVSCLFHREKHKRNAVKMYWTSSPCTTKVKTLCSYVFFHELQVYKTKSLCSKSHINASQNQTLSSNTPREISRNIAGNVSIPPLSSILNSMICLVVWTCKYSENRVRTQCFLVGCTVWS